MIIEVRKLALAEGEEVYDFGDKVMKALASSKSKLKKSLRLLGIYSDHIVTRDAETGSLFKMALSRGDAGTIMLGSPDEVLQSFMTLKEASALKMARLAKVMVETGDAEGHKHSADVDAEGNGKTNAVNGHTHEVVAFKVAEAAGHTHPLEKPAKPEGEADGEAEARKKSDEGDIKPVYVTLKKAANLWAGLL